MQHGKVAQLNLTCLRNPKLLKEEVQRNASIRLGCFLCPKSQVLLTPQLDALQGSACAGLKQCDWCTTLLDEASCCRYNVPADTPGLAQHPALGMGRMRDACTLLAAAARSDPIALVACSWQVFLTASALLQVRQTWLWFWSCEPSQRCVGCDGLW